MSVIVPHSLGKEEATRRLSHFVERIQEKFRDQVSDMSQSWDGDDLTFGFQTYGINLDGRIVVGEDELKLDGNLPIAAMMFKGKIESSIQSELEKLLA